MRIDIIVTMNLVVQINYNTRILCFKIKSHVFLGLQRPKKINNMILTAKTPNLCLLYAILSVLYNVGEVQLGDLNVFLNICKASIHLLVFSLENK